MSATKTSFSETRRHTLARTWVLLQSFPAYSLVCREPWRNNCTKYSCISRACCCISRAWRCIAVSASYSTSLAEIHVQLHKGPLSLLNQQSLALYRCISSSYIRCIAVTAGPAGCGGGCGCGSGCVCVSVWSCVCLCVSCVCVISVAASALPRFLSCSCISPS